ncbi:transcriptional regulator [Novosphingobium sp. SG720]|uniref:winged helix-turn-helix domain-containing protein n=1 Tax=Novosphingobium sp. SG720 TaxID=2586998 RepID=UPI00144528B1|nr:transcriptional regulator [Novosphingobium sp. SG720]NKJ45138.1 DNA-binding HxlR family transcriptional regulator [Novosphingobium sp. SG720]
MPGSDRQAPYAYAGLDRIFHEKARLGIATSLAGHADGLGFSDLKALCGLTDGNLSRHLQVLEEAGFVALDKGYEGKRPHTRCRLTNHGREQFVAYLGELERVLRQASRATTGHADSDLKTMPQAG